MDSVKAEEHGNNKTTPKHGEPWFDDGNIILQAESTQFRVYRGILSGSSQVFADMFSVPQPAAKTELVEGCPIIHVSDTAKDWQAVLETLYQRRYSLHDIARHDK